ncbi:MAG TPA: ribose 5-phosphate isomerase B [Anaeromyxobacter sp.]|nr:ribose 5-phosphate isomerase B [Anaeromyxobacter sp.]
MPEKIVVGSDHAGVALRAVAARLAAEAGFLVEELGPRAGEKADYPVEARRVADLVAAGKARFGILVCGTGIGVSISANKVRGIRAALCSTEFEARMARAHNDANVLCMGERVIGTGVCEGIIRAFLSTAPEGGRHSLRVKMIMDLER